MFLWPSYFLIVLVSTLAVIALVFVIGGGQIDQPPHTVASSEAGMAPPLQRGLGLAFIILGVVGVFGTILRLRTPGSIAGWDYFLICTLYLTGWFLFTTSFKAVWQFLRNNWDLILTLALGLTAVCWLLFSYFAGHRVGLLVLALAMIAAWMLVRLRHRIVPSYWLLLLSLVVFTLELNAWYFSFIRDEYMFLDTARYFAGHPSIAEIGQNLFDPIFIYGMQPFFSTLPQALIIKLFDPFNFGWRFSSILPSALSLVFFYYFFHTFLARWVAFAGTFMLAVSHYLMAFSRIGYNNTQALLAMGLALAAAAWAIKSGKPMAFVTTGAAIALCFYVYPAALFIPLLVLWLLLLYHPPNQRTARVDWIILIGTALFLVVPRFFRSQSVLLLGTFLSNLDHAWTGMRVVQQLFTQFSYAFFSFIYTIDESHYVTVSYVDALTATFVLIGLGVLLRRVRADKFAFFVISAFAMLLLFVGATHNYSFPPNTRMFVLLPWFSLIAAIGLQWLAARFADVTRSPGLAHSVLGTLFLFMLGLNLYQAYGISVQRSTNQSFEPLFVHLAQNLAAQPTILPQTIAFVYDPLDHGVSGLRQMIEVDYLRVQVREIVVSAGRPLNLQGQLLAPDQVVAISPLLPVPVQATYENYLSSHQRSVCQMGPVAGPPLFDVWYPLTMTSPCLAPP